MDDTTNKPSLAKRRFAAAEGRIARRNERRASSGAYRWERKPDDECGRKYQLKAWQVFRKPGQDAWTILADSYLVGTAKTLRLAKWFVELVVTGNLQLQSVLDFILGQGRDQDQSSWM